MSATNGRKKKARLGPRSVTASAEARRMGALILEAFSGLKTTQEAADAMGVALPRYYVLETRALEGLLQALEPRARGRKRSVDREIESLQADVKKLEREVRRYQALQRASQRALGVAPSRSGSKPKAAKKTKTRRKRTTSRAERIIARLDAPRAERPSEDPDGGGEP